MGSEKLLEEWFKIEQHLGTAEGWSRCLYDGRPSMFGSLEAAQIALNDRSRYPARLAVGKWDCCVVYRIVKVTETQVLELWLGVATAIAWSCAKSIES